MPRLPLADDPIDEHVHVEALAIVTELEQHGKVESG